MKNWLKVAAIAVIVVVALKVAFMSAWILAGVLVAWLLVTMTKKGKVWGQLIKRELKSVIDNTTRIKYAIAQLKEHKEAIWNEGGKMIERIELLESNIKQLTKQAEKYRSKAKKSKESADIEMSKEYLRLAIQSEAMIVGKTKMVETLTKKAKKVKFNMEKIEIKVQELENLLSEVKLAKSDIDAKRLLSGGINTESIETIVNSVNAELKGEEFKNELLDVPESDEPSYDEAVEKEYKKL